MQPIFESKNRNLEQNAVKSFFSETRSTKIKNGHFINVQFQKAEADFSFFREGFSLKYAYFDHFKDILHQFTKIEILFL